MRVPGSDLPAQALHGLSPCPLVPGHDGRTVTFPRALALLLLALGVVGLVLLLTREGPSVRPGDEDGGERAGGPPGRLGGDAPPPAPPTGTVPAEPSGPPPVAPTPDAPVAPKPRGPQALRVLDEAGAPISGADVAVLDDLPDLRARRRRPVGRAPRTTGVTEPDGAFMVAADAPPSGAVRVRANGFVETTVGLTPFPTEIRLARVRGLRVRVLDDRAHPVAGATVRAVGPERDVEATAGPDGRVEIVADGTDWRRLEVFADGFVVAMRDTTLLGLPREETITFVLEAATPLAGRVVADEDGRPIAGATVQLVSGAVEGGTFATTTSGPDGGFALPVEMPRMFASSIRVTAPDRLPGVVVRGASPPSPAPLEIRLERGRTVLGLVKDDRGTPVAGARVEALPVAWSAADTPEGDALTRATTDAQGRFQVRAPKAGPDASWQVVARGPDGTWGSLPVRDAEAGTTPLVIVLGGLGTLEGRVVSSTGVGEGGVRVRPTYTTGFDDWLVGQEVPATWDGGVPLHIVAGGADSALTAADGRFRIGPLPEGSLVLSLEREGRPIGRSVEAHVAGGRTTVLEPIVLGAAEISGVVLDVQGRPAAGVFVRLGLAQTGASWGLSSVVRDTRTDDVGRFRFTSLEPREAVSLQAMGPGGEAAHLYGILPRAEPFQLRLGRLPQLILSVTRGGQLYDGPLLVSVRGSLPSEGAAGGSPTLVSMSPTWRMCVVGHLSLPVRAAAPYTVDVRSAEEEPASASGVSEVDPADRSVTRVTLDLRVPESAAPSAGMTDGR